MRNRQVKAALRSAAACVALLAGQAFAQAPAPTPPPALPGASATPASAPAPETAPAAAQPPVAPPRRQGPPPPPPPPPGWPTPGQPVEYLPKSAQGQHQPPAWPTQTRAPYTPAHVAFQVKTVAEGLEYPWGLAFLPDGRMLVTERPGRIRIVSQDGKLSPPVVGVPPVHVQQISGLQDVVLDPHFAQNHIIYWTYVEARSAEGPKASSGVALARARLVDDPQPRVEDLQIIYRQKPDLVTEHSNYGGRMIFGADGYLYLTLGDRDSLEWRPYIQKLDNGVGKVIRIKTDGSAAPGNPFAGKPGALPELWSYGFRNPLGVTFRGQTKQLWVVDVGPRGGDYVELVKPGRDYGWPVSRYGQEYSGEQVGVGPSAPGMEQPVYYWDPVISPSSITFYDGKLFPAWKGDAFVTSLTQKHLVRLQMDGDKVAGEERLLADLDERMREVKEGPDGSIYLITDNQKGRILRLVP
jgi:aldose sugar dehydrogenase